MVEENATPNGTRRRRRRHPSSSSLTRRRILFSGRQPLRMTMILLLFLTIAVTVEAKVTKTEIVFCGGGSGSLCTRDEGKQLSRLFGGKSIQLLTFNNHRRRRLVVDQPVFLSRTRRKRRMINEQRQRKEFEFQVQELVR